MEFLSLLAGIYHDPATPNASTHSNDLALPLPVASHSDPILFKILAPSTQLPILSFPSHPNFPVRSQRNDMSRPNTHIDHVHAAIDVH